MRWKSGPYTHNKRPRHCFQGYLQNLQSSPKSALRPNLCQFHRQHTSYSMHNQRRYIRRYRAISVVLCCSYAPQNMVKLGRYSCSTFPPHWPGREKQEKEKRGVVRREGNRNRREANRKRGVGKRKRREGRRNWGASKRKRECSDLVSISAKLDLFCV